MDNDQFDLLMRMLEAIRLIVAGEKSAGYALAEETILEHFMRDNKRRAKEE